MQGALFLIYCATATIVTEHSVDSECAEEEDVGTCLLQQKAFLERDLDAAPGCGKQPNKQKCNKAAGCTWIMNKEKCIDAASEALSEAPEALSEAPEAQSEAPEAQSEAPEAQSEAPEEGGAQDDSVQEAKPEEYQKESSTKKGQSKYFSESNHQSGSGKMKNTVSQEIKDNVPAEALVVCPELAELQVNAETGTCHVAGRSIAELAVSGLFGDNVEVKSVRYSESGASGFDLGDISLSVGLHPITVQATDLAGNTRECTRHIRVLDTQKPEWILEAPLSIFSPEFLENECTMSSLHAINSFESLGWSGKAKDNCGEVQVKKVLSNLAGDVLYDTTGETTGILMLGNGPTESYQIVYIATDASGNEETHTVELKLQDSEAPTDIQNCPPDAYYEVEDGTLTKEHSWELPTVSKDNCIQYHPNEYPVAVEKSGLTPGHEFPLGATIVSYALADPTGNAYAAGCDFTVIVKQKVSDPVWMQCPDDIVIDTEQDAEFGILPELTGKATQHEIDYPVTYDLGVTAGMPFHFGSTHLTMRTESGTHLAECTFKVTVNDKQKPKVDGRVYRCLDMDSDDAEPYAVCDGPKPVITKDDQFVDTHQYTVDKIDTISSECCDDVHGAKYTCSEGEETWTSSYCTPA